MALLSRILGRRQHELHAPHDYNELAQAGAVAMAAATHNTRQMLAYLPEADDGSPEGSPSPRNRRSLGRSRGRRVQLNVDVSPEMRRHLRSAAKRQGGTITELANRYFAEGLARERQ